LILTYKLLHNKDFSWELSKVRKVAEYAIKHRTFSSKDVKHIGLKSAIANQILKKYGKNKKAKAVSKVKMTVPSQSINLDKDNKTITIPCLKYSTSYNFPTNFEKVNQIEIGEQYLYVSVSIEEPPNNYLPCMPNVTNNKFIEVDLNTTGHVAVISNPRTGKVWKLGKAAEHIHKKYRDIRRGLQKQGKYRKVKQIKDRESRVVRNLNHHISKKIVQIAVKTESCIRLERLQNIRQNKKHAKSFNYSLNSWSFYQLKTFVEYKSKLQGIYFDYIDPRYTSQTCSRCGHIGKRTDKKFKCRNPYCRHIDHADVNASFGIGKPILYCDIIPKGKGMDRFNIDRSDKCNDNDMLKGSTDTPKKATPDKMMETLEPHTWALGPL
jgi:putative transposase